MREATTVPGSSPGDVTVSPIGGRTGRLRLTRGPMPPAELRYAGRDGSGWTFSDGRARYTFEAPPPGASGSPAVWADLEVSLVRWVRSQ